MQDSRVTRRSRRFGASILCSCVVAATGASAQSTPAPAGNAGAQAISIEALRATGLRDLQTLQDKVVALAEAFPEGSFDFRPMAGVRSAREVFLLLTAENYGMLGEIFGIKPPMEFADGKAGLDRLNAITSKDEVVRQLKASTASARAGLSAVQPDAQLNIPFFNGTTRPFNVALGAVLADQHEHLGQLIAYARANGVVPPWSKKGAM